MFLINKVKNLLGVIKAPKIESIQSYKDADLFLKGYKNYFKKRKAKTILPFINTYYIFMFENKNKQVSIIERLSYGSYYIVFNNDVWQYEPNIELFVWDNRNEINKKLSTKEIY